MRPCLCGVCTVGGGGLFVKGVLSRELRRSRIVGRPASIPTIRERCSSFPTRRYGFRGHWVRGGGADTHIQVGIGCVAAQPTRTIRRERFWIRRRRACIGGLGDHPQGRRAEPARARAMPRAVTKRSGFSVAGLVLLLRSAGGFGGVPPKVGVG